MSRVQKICCPSDQVENHLNLRCRVCFQIQEGSTDVQEFLEEFLSMWRCVDDKYYVLKRAEENISNLGRCDNPFVLGIDKYIEVVEVYVVTLLAMLLRDMDLAISWVEKAALPEQKRQRLMISRRNQKKRKGKGKGACHSHLPVAIRGG